MGEVADGLAGLGTFGGERCRGLCEPGCQTDIPQVDD